MILLDSLHINNGGGLVLLKYLVSEIEKKQLDIFYVFDERCTDQFNDINNSKKIFLKSNFITRLNFYRNNRSKYSTILCFGNLPPYLQTTAKVYTYFHQALFLDFPPNISVKQKLILKLKQFVFLSTVNKTDGWLVQTELMKSKLQKKIAKKPPIFVLPFYESVVSRDADLVRKKNNFVYISNASPHKNHLTLIKSFCDFYDKNKKGKLTLTVDGNFLEICDLIKKKQTKNYPIINLGLISKETVYKLYQENDFLIFPSLSESFGLPLIEAVELGCKVIASDLPYTYAVCKPSLVFNPYDSQSIANAFERATKNKLEETEIIASNKILEILNLLN